jgi:hypothetical protein
VEIPYGTDETRGFGSRQPEQRDIPQLKSQENGSGNHYENDCPRPSPSVAYRLNVFTFSPKKPMKSLFIIRRKAHVSGQPDLFLNTNKGFTSRYALEKSIEDKVNVFLDPDQATEVIENLPHKIAKYCTVERFELKTNGDAP